MITETGLGHFLTAFKASKTHKELHHYLTTVKVFNTEKKYSVTFLRLLKLLMLKKVFITFLWLLKFFKYSVKGRLSYSIYINELDLLWGPSFIALGIYFFIGTKFSWNKGIDTCFNVQCVLLGCNFDFLGGYLVVTARYLVVTTG